jgi:hypothetical protein
MGIIFIVPNGNNKRSMEDKITEVMRILQDYFNRPTPLDEATDSILRLFSVVGRSEQLACDCDRQPLRYNELGICKYCGKHKPSKG